MSADDTSKLLRKAAYWLTDYANAFRNVEEPGGKQFREKLRKLAKECRAQATACPSCGVRGGFHEVLCTKDTTPPPFGAMHS